MVAQKWIKSFNNAFNGWHYAFNTQPNIRIHLAVAILVILTGLITGLNKWEWGLILLCIGLVISLEIMNSAVEKLVDLVCPEYSKQAGMIKDLSAGAVLFSAVTAVIVGLIIFIPKLSQIF